MERPILTLGPREFLQGIAPNAHTERGGLFLSATGVTPMYDPGGTASVENGLLQAGPTPTDIGSSTVVDTIFAADSGVINSQATAAFYGNDGNIYRLLTSGSLTNVRTVSTPKAGIRYWRGALYYWNAAKIGRTTDFSSFSDSAISPLGIGSNIPAPHVFLDQLYFFANVGQYVSRLTDDTTVEDQVLDFDTSYFGTAISDDGVNLVVALSSNTQGADVFGACLILFWDTFSSSWQRDYLIRDPFIWALKRIGSTLYAFGQYGIYEVSFGGGVKKVLSRLIGFGTTEDLTSGFGAYRADVYNQDALIFGTDTTIDTFGSLDSSIPPAYYKHFKVPSAVGTPSCVFANFAVGSVYVATDGDKLYRYDFDGATRETGVSFQTVYIPFKEPTQVHRIDVIFGELLASGDAFDIDTKVDEDTSAVDFGSATFTSDGAIRRKEMHPDKGVQVNNQLSIVGNFTAGAAKIKRIEIFGQPLTLGTN